MADSETCLAAHARDGEWEADSAQIGSPGREFQNTREWRTF